MSYVAVHLTDDVSQIVLYISYKRQLLGTHMSDSKLSADLEYWREQKPSQWKMDEFVYKAKLLENRILELEENAQRRESEAA